MKNILFALTTGLLLVGVSGCAGNMFNHRWFWEKGGEGCQSCGGGAGGCTGCGDCSEHGFVCPRCGCHQGDPSGHCKACGAMGGGQMVDTCQRCGSGDCDASGHCAHCGGLFGHCHGNPGEGVNPGPSGDGGGATAYPYYTNRGPRDFFAKNPPSIGP